MAVNNLPPIPQDKIEENPRWREWFRNLGTYIAQTQSGSIFAKTGANSDITSLNGLTTPLPIEEGGTGANNANQAKINLGITSGNNTYYESYQIATAGQTVFTGLIYTVGNNSLKVYVNGSKQIRTVNYNETTSSSITFITGLNVGDYVEFVI